MDSPSSELELDWLGEIIEQLENDPDECWQALEGLASVERDVRLAVIDALSRHRLGPGAGRLLRLLSSMSEPGTSQATRLAIEAPDVAASNCLSMATPATSGLESDGPHESPGALGETGELSSIAPAVAARSVSRLASCVVTPVDGQGRGSVMISLTRGSQRRTAAFLCDVQKGIVDVVGDVEPESPGAGGLLDELARQPGIDCVRDVPELAISLLAGSLLVCGAAVPPEVRDWLDGTLGPEFQPAALPPTIPGFDPSSIPHEELPQRARLLLDACPSWLDASSLTYELAEEIWLREGKPTVVPDRDAGAYRFLFEHRLIHRLELYRRMLLWMAWLWRCSGQEDLMRSALVFAYQLSDEQYAVPSHPFTVEFTTRSLEVAQARLRTAEDARSSYGEA
jgi:hypothetical protein